MEPALDHLVWAVPDLSTGVADFAEQTGVQPVAGGRHVERGTANYLVSLGRRSYLEILGPDPEADRPPQWFGLATLARPTLVAWAVRSNDLDASVAAARAHGYDPGQPESMSRETATTRVSWRLTPAAGIIPFLIDWGSSSHPTEARLPQLSLIELQILAREPAQVDAALGALGVRVAVTASTHDHLLARLGTPRGPVQLIG